MVASDVGSDIAFHMEYLSKASVERENVKVIECFGRVKGDSVGT